MARIRYTHNSFSVGIISKKIQGNTDFEGYNNALNECENFQVQSTGGLCKRAGTHFVAELKGNDHGHTGNARLILFAYSADAQYICEFGTNYIRFFTKYGPVLQNDQPYEVATTLDYYDDIVKMFPIQDGNILYLITPHGMFSLTRVKHTEQEVEFKFEQARGYSYEPLTFPNVEAIGLIPTTKSGTITINARDPDHPDQPPAAKYSPVFVNADQNHYLVLTYDTFDEEIQMYDTMAFYLKIESVSQDGNQLTATIDTKRSYRNKSELPNTDMVLDWQISAFNEIRGLPKSAAMFEGRLFLANNKSYPTGIWGSSKFNNDWMDFSLGSNAADGVQYRMLGQNFSEILWIAAQSKLFLGTRWGIYMAGAASFNDEAISPSNFRVRLFEMMGVSKLPPICALDAIFFVDASEKNVHEIVLSADTGTYQVNDLSLLANDLTQSGIISHAWQQTPTKTYWCATGAGHLCALTYLKNNEILAWSKHVIAGYNVSVSDLCTMHGDDSDRLYMIVQRDFYGVFKKYIEYLGRPHDPLTQEQFKQFYVDSGVSKFIQYKIDYIEQGHNAYMDLDLIDSSNAKLLLHTIFNKTKEAFVVFRWNKIGQKAPDSAFSNLKRFCLEDKISIYNSETKETICRYEIFDDLVNWASQKDADNPEKYYGKIDPDKFKDPIPEYSYDVYVKISNITKIEIGMHTLLKCDTHFLADNDEILLFDTGLAKDDDYFDYDISGLIFLARVVQPGIVMLVYKNGITVDTTSCLENLDKSEIYKKTCTPRFLVGSKHDQIVLTEPISAEHKKTIENGVYINKVPGMFQINSRRFDFKQFLEGNDKKLALYDPEASPVKNLHVDLDASLYSPYDTNYRGGNVYLYFTKMEGLEHLAGQQVSVCADGNSRGIFEVDENGEIDLGEVPAMYCSAGLKYTSVMETVPFSGGSLLGSSVGCVGSQKSMYAYLYCSLGGKYGSESDKLYDIPYPKFPYELDQIKALYTGVLKCPIMNAHDIYSRRIRIEHDDPLALNVLSITQDSEVSDA